MLKVYFAAAMLGDRSNLDDDRKVLFRLKELGYEILTEWVIDEVLDVEREVEPREIFRRDIEMLEACDVVVADISYPSLGVGFEIAYALLRGKPVITFCRKDRIDKTSALLRGIEWNSFELVTYGDVDELVAILDRKLRNLLS